MKSELKSDEFIFESIKIVDFVMKRKCPFITKVMSQTNEELKT